MSGENVSQFLPSVPIDLRFMAAAAYALARKLNPSLAAWDDVPENARAELVLFVGKTYEGLCDENLKQLRAEREAARTDLCLCGHVRILHDRFPSRCFGLDPRGSPCTCIEWRWTSEAGHV